LMLARRAGRAPRRAGRRAAGSGGHDTGRPVRTAPMASVSRVVTAGGSPSR
jgi:hypothetical protein